MGGATANVVVDSPPWHRLGQGVHDGGAWIAILDADLLGWTGYAMGGGGLMEVVTSVWHAQGGAVRALAISGRERILEAEEPRPMTTHAHLVELHREGEHTSASAKRLWHAYHPDGRSWPRVARGPTSVVAGTEYDTSARQGWTNRWARLPE